MRVDNRTRSVAALVVAWALVLGIAVGPQPAQSISLGGTVGDLVKIFGIAWVVREFDDQIDSAINGVLAQREARIADATKVVPIIRVGAGTAVGAAQVMGPTQQVRTTEVVAELELSVGDLRGRALIPVSTRRGLDRSPDGVPGVGVSANIKFPI